MSRSAPRMTLGFPDSTPGAREEEGEN